MGHEIRYFDYPENVNRAAVQKEMDALAARNGWEEGVRGLASPIVWHDRVCLDEDEARKFIDNRDTGWYCQLAVKYRVFPKLEPTKTLLSLRARLDAERDKYNKYLSDHSVSKLKAEYVGCPECGSKLKRELLRAEKCPLCRKDLRSKTTLDTLARYSANIDNLHAEIKAEEKKMKEKEQKKSTIKWLVKVEYHV